MKIFGVGMNKTGTKSLEMAVQILGFSTGDTSKKTSALMQRAIDEGLPILHHCPPHVRRANAFFDCRPIEKNFEAVDRAYPDSKFILHTRDMEEWLASREKHVVRNQAAAEAGAYDGPWVEVDRKAWVEEWVRHHDSVRRYFANRPDFLEIDVASGDGWDVLAPFLGCPIPDVPMPWRNAAAENSLARADSNRVRSIVKSIIRPS